MSEQQSQQSLFGTIVICTILSGIVFFPFWALGFGVEVYIIIWIAVTIGFFAFK